MIHPSSESDTTGQRPKVSVVIPCRNEIDHIGACLAGVLALEPSPGGFEVIVADGMSGDGTREVLARLVEKSRGKEPLLRLIDNPAGLTSCGLNAAIAAARGDVIVRADAHTEYSPDYLVKCFEVLQQTCADNVGGPARTKADGYWQKAIAAAYHSPFSVGGARFHDPDYEGCVDTVTYGCWPRKTFEKFGLFDEGLVRNQDDEHNLRITRGGGKIYQSPKIQSWYRPRSSPVALFKQYMQYGYWKVRVIQKHKLPASWRHLVPGGFVATLALLFLGCAFCCLLSAFDSVPLANSRIVLWSCASLLLALGSYFVAIFLASIVTAAKTGWTLLPVLPAVFACYHFGYGHGFLRGVLDFVVLRRGVSSSFARLTRGPHATKTPAPANH